LHESRELCLEEVKSKETDRPATGDEARAVLEADALLGNGDEGNAEVVVEKDVLVEEFTRSESTHEEKVSPESLLDPEGGSNIATVVVLVLVVGISSIKIPKTFLIRSGSQRNFAYTFMLTFRTDLPSQILHLCSS